MNDKSMVFMLMKEMKWALCCFRKTKSQQHFQQKMDSGDVSLQIDMFCNIKMLKIKPEKIYETISIIFAF